MIDEHPPARVEREPAERAQVRGVGAYAVRFGELVSQPVLQVLVGTRPLSGTWTPPRLFENRPS